MTGREWTKTLGEGTYRVEITSQYELTGTYAMTLHQTRAAQVFDVDAATDATRVLSLSEGALRHMIAEDATMAAKLLLNLSKVLCVKLIRTH